MVSAAAIADVVMLCEPELQGAGGVTIALLVVINFLFGVCAQLVNVAVMAVRQIPAHHPRQDLSRGAAACDAHPTD